MNDWSKVFTILIRHCGAREADREVFIYHMNREPYPIEYRFCGKLGFGGKFWRSPDRLYVNCYPEHLDKERSTMIESANAELRTLNLNS